MPLLLPKAGQQEVNTVKLADELTTKEEKGV